MLDDFDGLLNWDNLQDWIAANDLPGSGPVDSAVPILGGSSELTRRQSGERRELCRIFLFSPDRILQRSGAVISEEKRARGEIA